MLESFVVLFVMPSLVQISVFFQVIVRTHALDEQVIAENLTTAIGHR